MLAGSLLLSLGAGRRERSVPLSGFTLIGGAFVGIAFSPWLMAAGTCLAAAGMGLSVVNITRITLFQKLLDDNARGKIMALISAIALSLQPVAYGVMGLITDILKPAGAMLTGGAMILLVTMRIARLKALKEV